MYTYVVFILQANTLHELTWRRKEVHTEEGTSFSCLLLHVSCSSHNTAVSFSLPAETESSLCNHSSSDKSCWIHHRCYSQQIIKEPTSLDPRHCPLSAPLVESVSRSLFTCAGVSTFVFYHSSCHSVLICNRATSFSCISLLSTSLLLLLSLLFLP